MTKLPESSDLDHLAQYFINVFPPMSAEEQRLALGLYTMLVEGQPVAIEQLSGRFGGEQWVANHEGTFLLPLNDAFTVGKKMNAIRYKKTLTTLQGN